VVCPSTDDDEYVNASDGAGPPNDGGTVIGIDVENPPPCNPPAHEYVGDSDVFVKSPADDDEPAVNANTVPPEATDAPPAAVSPGTSSESIDTTRAVSVFTDPDTRVCT